MSSFKPGDRVRHKNGWTGTIKEQEEGWRESWVHVTADEPHLNGQKGFYQAKATSLEKIQESCISPTHKILTDQGWKELGKILSDGSSPVANPYKRGMNPHPGEAQDEYGRAVSTLKGLGDTLHQQERNIWNSPLVSQQEMEVTHCKMCGRKFCMHSRKERR